MVTIAKAVNTALNADGAALRVRVLTPAVHLGVLDYVPLDQPPQPGQFVRVPLGQRKVIGVVWDTHGLSSHHVAAEKLRPILEVLDVPALPLETLRFVEWVANYYLAPPSAVLKMAMSVREALESQPTALMYAKNGAPLDRLTPKRKAVLNALRADEWLPAPDIARRAGVSSAVVLGLAKAGGLGVRSVAKDQPYPWLDFTQLDVTLSPAQREAADQLWVHAQDTSQPLLLDGVTGSGKTEVYFDVLARCLAEKGGQALVLLPEIALSTQWLARFEARFGSKPVLWHSGLGVAERRRAWRAIISGAAQVVVGARSALFLPFAQLSLIIVDEEHDPAFKQEDGINYNARDMAVVRASLSKAALVLASATPSLESLTNAEKGRYTVVTLKERHGEAILPDIELIDLREDALNANEWLSAPMRAGIAQAVEAGNQALIFLNRRGYAPVTLCRSCGEKLECPQCSAWLVEHRFDNALHCHHCGFSMPKPKACPACDKVDSLVPCGPGVERLAEEVAALFPNARILQMTSDTMGRAHRTQDIIDIIERGAADIIIGTQLVSKGYHFPNLTFVGVPDADMGLGGGDLRAAERTFQQMTQVSGRAGRGQKRGRVMLQSYMPEHAVMQALASGQRDQFLRQEAAARQRRMLPPFGRLASVIVSGKGEAETLKAAQAIARQAPQMPGVSVLGPAPAPLALLRGRYRMRLLLMAERSVYVPKVMREWMSRTQTTRAIRVTVDIDPYSFL
ncbi:MAG: primosomal protein N' [Pseudomonadota bacterium]